MSTNSIAFTGGGTAGHVFPAFPVVQRLKKAGFKVFWIGSIQGMEKDLVERAGIRYIGVPAGKLRRYWSWKNFTDLFRIARGFFVSRRVLKKEKPFILCSKGGFVSVPPTAAARSLGIPSLTHESDVDPGLATRLNLKLHSRAMVAYSQTLDYLPAAARARAVVVGNPVRDLIFEGDPSKGRALAGLSPDDHRPLLLVLGGSQGAREVNELIFGALDDLKDLVAVVHQTGPGNLQQADRDGYMSRPFFNEELPHLMAAADIAVARSGAGSLWELAATKTPTIFVPLREATRGDQVLNAKMGEDAGLSVTLGKEASSQDLVKLIKDLISDKSRLITMADGCDNFPAASAADNIVATILEYVE